MSESDTYTRHTRALTDKCASLYTSATDDPPVWAATRLLRRRLLQRLLGLLLAPAGRVLTEDEAHMVMQTCEMAWLYAPDNIVLQAEQQPVPPIQLALLVIARYQPAFVHAIPALRADAGGTCVADVAGVWCGPLHLADVEALLHVVLQQRWAGCMRDLLAVLQLLAHLQAVPETRYDATDLRRVWLELPGCGSEPQLVVALVHVVRSVMAELMDSYMRARLAERAVALVATQTLPVAELVPPLLHLMAEQRALPVTDAMQRVMRELVMQARVGPGELMLLCNRPEYSARLSVDRQRIFDAQATDKHTNHVLRCWDWPVVADLYTAMRVLQDRMAGWCADNDCDLLTSYVYMGTQLARACLRRKDVAQIAIVLPARDVVDATPSVYVLAVDGAVWRAPDAIHAVALWLLLALQQPHQAAAAAAAATATRRTGPDTKAAALCDAAGDVVQFLRQQIGARHVSLFRHALHATPG